MSYRNTVMSVNDEYSKLVSLGDYIELCDERNSHGKYTLDDIRGISTEKKFIATKANLDGVSLSAYKVVQKGEFAYVSDTSRRGDKIALGLNTSNNPVLISSIYTTFRTIDTKKLLPVYLYLFFTREEFDRYSRFNSWGSARETFDWSEFCRIQIPLPDIETQQELVDTYNGLKALAEQNEALIKPLTEACQAYIVDCKKKYPEVELGGYIEPCDERNKDLSVKLSQGISNTKEFQSPKQVAANSNNDKIVRKGQFAYNRATTRNGEKISIAYRVGDDCTVSSAYQIFKVTDKEILNPYFLWLYFKRPEFDRYARYVSKGSAHEFFEFDEMCRVCIPLPPSEIQQAIVNLYDCAEEAKRIATEAREKMKMLCPALVQRAINS
jgi:type I restriction enzyme S subunit